MNKFFELARMLSTLQGEEYQGSVIARASWQRVLLGGRTGVFIHRKGKKFQQVECSCAAENGGREMLCVMLMLGGKRPVREEKASDSVAAVQGTWSRRFSAEEITDFVLKVNDHNRIHQGEAPVVPGLLLLQDILEKYPDQAAELRFYHAAFAAETIRLQKTATGISAYAGEKKVFTAQIGRR